MQNNELRPPVPDLTTLLEEWTYCARCGTETMVKTDDGAWECYKCGLRFTIQPSQHIFMWNDHITPEQVNSQVAHVQKLTDNWQRRWMEEATRKPPVRVKICRWIMNYIVGWPMRCRVASIYDLNDKIKEGEIGNERGF